MKNSKRMGPHSNRIPLTFDKAIEGLLAVKPKKKSTKPKTFDGEPLAVGRKPKNKPLPSAD